MLVVSRAANANPEADRKHSSQGRGPILVECRTGDRWSSSELEVPAGGAWFLRDLRRNRQTPGLTLAWVSPNSRPGGVPI